MRPRLGRLLVVVLGGLVTVVAAVRLGAQGDTPVTRVSVNSAGIEANGDSFFASLNGDGRFVAFKSLATNLDDTLPEHVQFDVFLHDRETGETRRVSLTSLGFAGNDNGFPPALSDDGNIVAFGSMASNMVPDDRNGGADVFVRDVAGGATELVSRTMAGTIPEFGGTRDVPPSLNLSGDLVAFETTAVLVPEDPNTNIADVYVYDRLSRTVELISVRTVSRDPEPAFAPAISRNGCVVAFVSPTGRLLRDGIDTNEKLDVYLRDRCADPAATELVSVDQSGQPADHHSQGTLFPPAISDDGNIVAFESDATDIASGDTNGVTDVFVRDRAASRTERVSINTYGVEGNGASAHPSVSGDGRYVVFVSSATNFMPNDTNGRADIFVRDRSTNQTCRVSLTQSLAQAAGDSVNPVISRDGQWIAFESAATNLVPNDANGKRDIFVVPNRSDMQECPPTPTPTSTATKTPTSTPTPPQCCDCPGEPGRCEDAVGGLCSEGCNLVDSGVCLPRAGHCATVTPTPTPPKCCDCPSDPNLCEDSADGSCPASCGTVDSAVCFSGEGCATVTPTPTPPQCCDCPSDSNLCQDALVGECPQACSLRDKAVCFSGVGCATVTPTPTVPVCCACAGEPDRCEDAVDGECPTECASVNKAVCIAATGQCATVTPTPTPPKCCDCPSDPELCEDSVDGSCPASCGTVDSAVCFSGVGCATVTPTPTPPVCCECASDPNLCQDSTEGQCPSSCDRMTSSVCFIGVGCATVTPTPTPPKCCDCPSDPELCEDSVDGSCPASCGTVDSAVCFSGVGCATVTPTPTLGPNDCCQCPDLLAQCESVIGGECRAACNPVRDAFCAGAPDGCVERTATPTPTVTPTGPTVTPTGPTATPTGPSPTATSGTPTATRTKTPFSGGGGGGCGCEIHPTPRNRAALAARDLLALLGPIALVWWRRRRR